MPCPFQWLVITDGTTDDAGIRNQVDLLSASGFCLLEDGDWRPAIAEPKGGGVWKDSQLADGRRPADFKAQNVIEQMTLTVSALDQDALIRDTQELRRLLTKARTYGTTDWQTEPVWIEAQGNGETNMRYAIIWDWRTPNDGNPYEQPFWQQLARAGMNDFTLTLEREPYWRADEPGSSTCVEAAGYGTYCHPCYVEFNGTNTLITVTDNALIQNLHNGTMTVEAWINVDSINYNFIVSKYGAGATGWVLCITTAFQLYAIVTCAGADGQAKSTPATVPIGEWCHVAFTWDNAVDNYPHIWLNGNNVTNATVNRGGAISSDIGNDLYIGGSAILGGHWFDGDIGWVRISNQVLYNATFTPPERCYLPADVPGVTVGQWIGAECSGNTIDNQEGTAAIDGTLANGSFDCDCYHTYGNVDEDEDVDPTCEDEVYIANKQNMANITHIFTWSAANGFSANLLGGGVPFDLIDIAGAAPAANDYVVFGCDVNMLDSGPFCSLVFDIGTAIAGITANDWEYSTGGPGWANLAAEQDNTNQDGAMTGSAFDTLGVGSVHWATPAAWANQVENGIDGYWVRVLVTAAPGPHTAPTQQHRDVYTVTWPYVEIQEDDIGGDIAALAREAMRNQSHYTGAGGSIMYAQRIVAGLRTYDRGANFTAYINLSNEQNPAGIAVTTPGPTTTVVNYIDSPSGHAAQYTPAGVEVMGVEVRLDFSSAIVAHFYGKFRAYLRATQSGGATEDFAVRLHIYWPGEFVSDTAAVVSGTLEVLDLGMITLPQGKTDPSEIISFARIDIEASCSNAAPGTLTFIDLILIPVDEWAGDFVYTEIGTSRIQRPKYLDVDSIVLPKYHIRSILRDADDYIYSTYQSITPSPVLLQSNAQQRLWIFAMRDTTLGYWDARFETSHTVRAWRNQRYFSMRGSR